MGRYLWEWYSSVAKTRRKDQGIPQKLTPLELKSWAEITGTLIRAEEYQVLMEMDAAFINATLQEYSDQASREQPAESKQRSK